MSEQKVPTSENHDAALEDKVMEALRQCLIGDRAIPEQHEQWWRNLAREAIAAARAGMLVSIESLRHERNEWRRVAVERKREAGK